LTGWLVFSENITFQWFVGVSLVLFGVYFIAMDELSKNKKKE